MAKRIDIHALIGKTYHSLVILGEGDPHYTTGGNVHRTVFCRCVCGKVKLMQMSSVLGGRTKSCGCYNLMKCSDRATQRNTKHGKYKLPEYNVWMSIKKRCNNEKNKNYPNYGGRGISICEKWDKDFSSFLNDMGLRPSPKHSIDRINNDGNYEPGNCRWAVSTEQQNNKRNNRVIHFNGRSQTISQWAKEIGISFFCLYERINTMKWSVEDAITRPLTKKNESKHKATKY